MIQIIAAVLMWLLVVRLLPGTRRRRDHSVLTAAITIAVAMTLNIDQVYTSIDASLAGRNYVDLLAYVSLVVCIDYLSRAIIRAASSPQIDYLVAQNPQGPYDWGHVGIYVGDGLMYSALNPSVVTLLHPIVWNAGTRYFDLIG
ncbi:hypothetical protein [Paenarthrobacter ilicis]|uniref:hypothetical protein n=1 Tax=Paenarthrobacter ilicis TaxID=43665 RepID=UPI00386DD9A6